jgi:hypothetical protein
MVTFLEHNLWQGMRRYPPAAPSLNGGAVITCFGWGLIAAALHYTGTVLTQVCFRELAVFSSFVRFPPVAAGFEPAFLFCPFPQLQ